MRIWEPIAIEPEQCLQGQIGPLCLWVRRSADELHAAFKRLSEPEAEVVSRILSPTVEPEPEGLAWSRWIAGKEENILQLIPVMPDRSVVVRPESAVKIPSGQEAVFFISIPIWVKLSIGESSRIALCTEPSVIMSGTWFGDPTSGELCYSLQSRARRCLSDSERRPHRCICPVRIKNASPDQIDIQRLCVALDHLRIYDSELQLWTNQVTVVVQGPEQTSKIDYSNVAPEYESVGKLLTEAKVPQKKTLLKRSISSLQSISGI